MVRQWRAASYGFLREAQEPRPALSEGFEDLWQSHQGRQPRVKTFGRLCAATSRHFSIPPCAEADSSGTGLVADRPERVTPIQVYILRY